MEERKYSSFSDESLLIEAQNTISEINAFMGHHFVSERKIEQLSSRVNEIMIELNLRNKKWSSKGDAGEIKEIVSIISKVHENLKDTIDKLKKRFSQTQLGE